MTKRPQFINNELYHIYNRGVEKRNIFSYNKDYFRFIHGLYEFNDEAPAENIFYKRSFLKTYEVRLRKKQRKCLVEILSFCLMPNHFHLLLRQKIDHGITEFMRKLGTGYTNYFNLKYDRVGPLFQGKFKAILLEKEIHFTQLPHYIHMNPLDLFMPSWKENGVKEANKAITFLKKYRWSSLPDYLENKNFPAIIERGFLKECIGEPSEFIKGVRDQMRNVEVDTIQNLILE